MRYIDKYKMTSPTNIPWDTAEWQFFAWVLSAFMLFILANVLWESFKDYTIDSVPVRLKIPEKQVVIISIREQLYLFLLRMSHYVILFMIWIWRYGKIKLHLLKHKIAQQIAMF